MSEQEPVKTDEQFPIKKYLATIKHLFTSIKEFDFKKFFRGIITFVSIIAAYLIIELTHQHSSQLQKITKLKLKEAKTIPLLFFVLSLYLIFWNIIARFLKNRALRPPPKSDEYQQIPQNEEEVPPTLAPLPNGEKYAHQIIEQSLSRTIYFFLLLVAVTSYAYFNQKSKAKLPQLLNTERLNYLGIWFLIAVLLDILGRLTHKLTKISQFKVLGVAVAFMVGTIVLGLAVGLNIFIFI